MSYFLSAHHFSRSESSGVQRLRLTLFAIVSPSLKLTDNLKTNSEWERRLSDTERAPSSASQPTAPPADADQLGVWLQYIKWTQDTLPSEHTALLQLLERCTAVFQDEERYKNDLRYVKTWIEYVSSVMHIQYGVLCSVRR